MLCVGKISGWVNSVTEISVSSPRVQMALDTSLSFVVVVWVVIVCMIFSFVASVWMLLLFTSVLFISVSLLLFSFGHQFYICQLISLVCFYFRGTCKIKLNVILYTSGSASDRLVTPQGHRPYYWKPAGELASHKPFNHAMIVRTFPPSTPNMLSLWAVGRDLQYSARGYDVPHVLDDLKVTIALVT